MSSKVLVTGAAGFIGSHLTDRLVERGCEVVGFDNLASGRRSNLAKVMRNPGFNLIEGDLADPQITMQALGECGLVFHLAADPEVRVGSREPQRQFQQNLVTTFNLLEALRLRGTVMRLVFASSSTVYGEPTMIPTPEDYAPLRPISVYGATKLACEALVSAYAALMPLRAVIFRFANVVGTRAEHGVVFDFIQKLRRNPGELEVLGDGTQSKSYLHVHDCVDAFLLALDDAFWPEAEALQVFNIGTEERTDVMEIARLIIQAMKLAAVKVRTSPGPQGRGWAGDVKVMQLSIGRIRERGWRPRQGSTEAVGRAVGQLLAEAEASHA